MSENDPLRQALRAASADIARPEAEQPALFDLPTLDPSGEIEQARARSLRGGRPKGAQNLATRELREWLLARGILPQQMMMEWLTLGPEGLAKALGCSKVEAFDRIMALADKLGRYFMAPMVPVDDQGKPMPSFNVIIGGSAGVVDGDGSVRPPWKYLAEQDQGLIDAAADAPKSEGE